MSQAYDIPAAVTLVDVSLSPEQKREEAVVHQPKVSDLTDSQVTLELLTLVSQAPPLERRLCILSIRGSKTETPDAKTFEELMQLVEMMPPRERRIQLVLARRWIGIGLRQYGALDPARDRRNWGAEGCAELADFMLYSAVPVLHEGGPTQLFDAGTDLTRKAIENELRRGTI